ncbi:hypothetical protein ES703_79219 [subsurface metagenome]
MIPHRLALGISDDLVKTSDRNLVHFYRREITAGSLKSVPTGARKRLKKAGLVGVIHHKGLTGSKVSLTSYGEALMEET